MSTLAATHMPSPIGTLTIVAHDTAVVAIRWDTDGDDADPDAHNPVDRRLGDPAHWVEVDPSSHPVLAAAVAQLGEYFSGRRTEFDLPIDPVGTDFQRRAWRELEQIPFGETITYGEQAVRLGDRNKTRAVGSANGKNPIPIVVPCHRVVGADGTLTGFAGGLDTKAWLLDHELQVRVRAT